MTLKDIFVWSSVICGTLFFLALVFLGFGFPQRRERFGRIMLWASLFCASFGTASLVIVGSVIIGN